MPPPFFVEMDSFAPDGGAFGPELALATNVLPVHKGWQPLRQKQDVATVADGPMRGAYVHVFQQVVQIQESGPVADALAGGWVHVGGSGTAGQELSDAINEVNPSDTNFIHAAGAPSQGGPGDDSAVLALPAALVDPVSAIDHLFRWRYRIPATTGAWSVVVDLAMVAYAVDSITRVGTTATATTTLPHGLSTGNTVWMSGADQVEYNIKATITVTSPTVFTFTVAGSPATPATTSDQLLTYPVWASDTASGSGAVTAFVQREKTLSAGEANSIQDYTLLRFIITAVVAGSAVQESRPVEDIAQNGWVGQAGATVDIYQAIDEASASTADYIKSPILALGGAMVTYKAYLDDVEDPLADEGFLVNFQARASNAGAVLKVRLKVGTVLLKEHTATIGTTFGLDSFTLSSEQWALVTTFDDLNFEAEASFPTATTSTVFRQIGPETDDANTGWAPSTGAFLFPLLDEASASDADFITAGSTLANVCELDLVDITDPGVDTDHSLKIRASAPSGASLIVRLKSGGITVRTWDFGATVPGVGPLTPSLTTWTLALTAAEGSLLSYSDIQVELTAYGASGGLGVVVSWLQLFVPERRWVELSWLELEGPSSARAEVSWLRLLIPSPAESYKGDVPTIYAGSLTKLYEVSGAGFTDISIAANYGAGAAPGFWRICSFGNNVIATNRADPVQLRENNAGLFKDLITSTLKPKARFATVVRNHLVLADINLSGHFSDEIWWSYFNDGKNFDGAPQGQGGNARVVSRPGQIMGLVGGDYGVIFKRNSMHLLGWQGGSIPFRLDDISPSTGTPYPSSIVQTPYGILFFDGATFRRYTGGVGEDTLTDIGNGVLSQFMTDTLTGYNILRFDPLEIYEEDAVMIGWWDPAARLAFWTWQHEKVEDSIARHTHGVVYNPEEDRWGFLLIAAEVAGRGVPSMSPVWASCWASMPNVSNSQTHIPRGTIGFSWDGTDSAWFRFDGPRTYEGLFTTKRRSLGVEGVPEEERAPQAARVTGLMPIFTHLPADSEVPNLRAVITMSNNPFFVGVNVRQKLTALDIADGQGIMPCDITGSWLTIEAAIPEVEAQDARHFRGFYLFWDWAGTPGSR